jgi:hypothetical protein
LEYHFIMQLLLQRYFLFTRKLETSVLTGRRKIEDLRLHWYKENEDLRPHWHKENGDLRPHWYKKQFANWCLQRYRKVTEDWCQHWYGRKKGSSYGGSKLWSGLESNIAAKVSEDLQKTVSDVTFREHVYIPPVIWLRGDQHLA